MRKVSVKKVGGQEKRSTERDHCPLVSQAMLLAKDSLRRRFLGHFADLRLLDLTLNEAESIAWETVVPQLLFPVLAEEKIAGALAWVERQRALKASTSEFSFAA